MVQPGENVGILEQNGGRGTGEGGGEATKASSTERGMKGWVIKGQCVEMVLYEVDGSTGVGVAVIYVRGLCVWAHWCFAHVWFYQSSTVLPGCGTYQRGACWMCA